MLRVGACLGQWDLSRIGTTSDRTLQPTVYTDAFYSPSLNVVFLHKELAGDPWIQQRPFNAVNFGSLGTITGHKIAHALSIRSRPFDETGIRHETWSKEAVAVFGSRTACLEAELAALDVGAKWQVDSHRTLDEDLAEWTGVGLAVSAMDADAGSTDDAARDERRRQFFVAYAEQVCGASAGQSRYVTNDNDVHSPHGRILDTMLAYVPEFAEAFHCPANTRMAARDRCALW